MLVDSSVVNHSRESQLPGDEYTGESPLPSDEYTEESRIPGSEYTGESITNSNISSNIRKIRNPFFFFLYIFRVFCVYVPLPPLRGQHTVLCHPRWLPTLGLTEFAVCWGEAGFEPRTTDLQSGALLLSHLSSSESFLGVSNGIRRRCFMKKTAKKSRDTVPLSPPPVTSPSPNRKRTELPVYCASRSSPPSKREVRNL